MTPAPPGARAPELHELVPQAEAEHDVVLRVTNVLTVAYPHADQAAAFTIAARHLSDARAALLTKGSTRTTPAISARRPTYGWPGWI